MNEDPTVKRQFTGINDLGNPFVIQYTTRGVRWIWGDDAEGYVQSANPREPRSSPQQSNTTAGAVDNMLDVAAGYVGMAARLASSAADLSMAWDQRQYRLMEAAQLEQAQRLPWMADMMTLWLQSHNGGQKVDLHISGFLARETVATMDAIVGNKKMAMPQSMLYELDLIREAVACTRQLAVRQFTELAKGPGLELVERAAPFVGARLNIELIERLGEDPSDEWSRRMSDRTSRSFDHDVLALTTQQETFLQALFSAPPDETPDLDTASASPIRRITAQVANIPELPKAAIEALREMGAARRHEFRELILFSAEVNRATALHSAWRIVDAIIRESKGQGVLVTEVDGRLALSTGSDGGELLSREPLRQLSP